MEQIQLTSHIRTDTGKGVARQLRRQGLLPAVLYGGELGNLILSVNAHDLRQIVARGAGESSLIHLIIEGAEATKNTNVIIKDYQLDPVIQTLLHADFLEVAMGKVLEVNVSLELIGESHGVKEGGLMEFVTREVAVECLPKNLVESIEIDISSMGIGDTLTVGDISVDPDKLKILAEPEIVVVTVTAPLAEEVEEEAAEERTEPELIQKGKKPEEEE